MASAEKLAALGLDPTVVRLLTKRKKKASESQDEEASSSTAPKESKGDGVQKLSDLPAFTPEERESIISKVGRKSLSGLQWVGESLDKPGRALRGLLAGKPGELLDILPFSDTLGITTPENDVSGRDVLEKYGVLGENTQGLDAGDVGGFLAEVALDPLSWVSLGGATVAKNAIKEGAKGAKALTTLDKLNEISDGTRSLLQVHTPSLGIPLPSKIPFTNVALPKLDVPVKVLGEYGTGEKAAKVYDAIQFGKYSPNPYVRKLFSPIEEVSTAPATGEAQKKGMQLYGERTRAMDDAATKANEWATEMTGTNVQLQELQNKTFGKVEQIDPTRMRADAVRTAYEASDEVKNLIRAEFGHDVRFDELLKDPKATGRLAEAYEKIVGNREAYGEFADEMEESFKTMEGMALDQMKAGADPRWFEDTVRALVERKEPGAPVAPVMAADLDGIVAGADGKMQWDDNFVTQKNPAVRIDGDAIYIKPAEGVSPQRPNIGPTVLNYPHPEDAGAFAIGKVGERKSAGDVFRSLDELGYVTPAQKSLFRELGEMPPMTLTRAATDGGRKMFGVYQPSTKSIDLTTAAFSQPNRTAEILLHEVIHAKTWHALEGHVDFAKYSPHIPTPEFSGDRFSRQREASNFESNTKPALQAEARAAESARMKEAKAELESLFSAALAADKAVPVLKGKHWKTNLHEFIAHAFTNPELQTWLASHASAGGKTSLWKVFVEAVRKLVGLSEGQRSMLDDVLASGANLMTSARKGEARTPSNLRPQWTSMRSEPENFGSDVDLSTILKTMKDAGFDEGIAGYDAAAQALYTMVDKLRGMDVMEKKLMDDLGINVGTWEDYYARHFFRGIDAPIGSPLHNAIKKRMVGSKAGFMESRDPIFNGIPGGTPKINKMSMDPDFAATKYNKEFDKANWARKGRNLFGPDVLAAPQPGSYLEPVHQMAKEAGYSWPMMQGIAREIKNLEKTARAGAITARKQVYDVVEGIMGKGWRSSVNAAVKNDADWRAVKVLDEAMQGLSDRFGMDPDDIWETLKKHNQAAYAEKNGDQIALEAMAKYEELQKADRENPLFDLANDPTSYPDPSYSGGKLEATLDNRAYLLAKKYDLPAWWREDEIVRANLKNSDDAEIAALANKDQSEHAFKREMMELFQNRQASLPEAEQWAIGKTDVDDFMIDYRKSHPELSKIPFMSQPDLHALVKKLGNMPQSVLKDGLFNRGVVRDAVDYMMQTAKVKAGVASMRKMLLEPNVLRSAKENGAGVSLSEVWSDMGLTKTGLEDFVKQAKGLPDLKGPELVAAVEDMLVDPTVADMAKRYIDLFKDTSEAMPWFEKAIDMGASWWKASMTLPYVAFHTRNRAGGIVSNWVAGILDQASDAEASKHFFGKTPIAEREALLNELKLHNIVSVGTDAGSTSKLNDRLDQYMGVGESKLPNSGGPLDYILAPFKEFKEDFVDAYQQGGVKKALRQTFRGGTTSTGKTAVDLNPFGFAGGFDPLGAAGRKGQVDVYGRPLSTIDRLKAPETTKLTGKVGTRANDYIEWMNRVGPYIYLRKNGWSPAMAARKVKQVQFDYRQMSPFEKKYMKRVIPFYSFMRKNIEQQVKLLMENPGGRTAQLIRAENVANKEGRSNGSYVPKYLAESFSVRLPGGTDKDAQFYSQSGLLPAEEAFNRLSFKDDGFPINMKRTAEKFMAMTNPAIQGPMEWLSGRQFWSGRNLDDLYQSPTSDQDVNLSLSKLPTQRLTGTIGGLLDDRKSLPLRAFNAVVGGAKVTDVNVAKQRALELRDILEQELPRDADIASFTGLYPKDLEKLISRFNAGDVEAAQMLKLYADLKQELKTIKSEEASKRPAQ